jgi:hypothetical protein
MTCIKRPGSDRFRTRVSAILLVALVFAIVTRLHGMALVTPSSMSTQPSSLSFEIINVGNSSTQTVTFTNIGDSNVTVSNVTLSGNGFSASGLSAGQILAPGQSETVSVTFAPTATGSVTGSITVSSDANNSPTSVALAGTGVTPSGRTPTCGKSGDSSNYVPTDWMTFVPPAQGQSYVDSTFGCSVTRITDASKEMWTGSSYLALNMGYATVSPFNANDTYLMLGDTWGRHLVADLTGNIAVPSENMPPMNNTWVLWDATNPGIFYYTYGNLLMQGTINGSSVAAAAVHQFSEYAAINLMDETDVSQDGAHVVIVGGDTTGASTEDIFDYNFVTNTKGAVYTTTCLGSVGAPNNGCLHKLIQTADNNVIIQFAGDGSGAEQGNRLWNGTASLLHIEDGTNHLDAGYDLNGNSVYVALGAFYVLSGEVSPCASGDGLDVRLVPNPLLATCLLDGTQINISAYWDVGYRGNAQQPWVGLSFFDPNRTPGPEWFDTSSNFAAPNSSNWALYEDEIMVVRVDANNNISYVYRLARAYSRSNEDFFAQPHAAISRDGKYIAFNSNMAYAHAGCPSNFVSATGCTDVYLIKIQ